ncbi:MAG: hypothetical protein O3A46_02320 [Candidatus Poribacteria bacterium]|nr:hypothetical protein [Candidatus Poribacteria bacterium]
MSTAYTPGLAVREGITLRKERKLPLTGDTLVNVGDEVSAETVVARTDLPGSVHLVNVAGALSVPESDVEAFLTIKKGDYVEAGQIVAETKGLFGLFKSQCRAPVGAVLESLSAVTGQAVFRERPTPLEVTAYVRGKVAEVLEGEGVVVETYATFVQGILGIGGETIGEIVVVVESPSAPLTEDRISSEHRGKVVVGGGRIESRAVRKAIEVGAVGIVGGGIDDADLRELLGYELGVAITGTEQLGVTLIVTEGFGDIAMAQRTFRLLQRHAGQLASINGATQIRAGVLRPEIVIPQDRIGETSDAAGSTALQVGAPVRVIREPHFGHVGEVVALPVELHVIETEARVRVVTVALENGEQVTLPRANIELIEAG